MASRFFTRSALLGSRFATNSCGRNVSGVCLNANTFRAGVAASVPFTRSTFTFTAAPAPSNIFAQPIDTSVNVSTSNNPTGLIATASSDLLCADEVQSFGTEDRPTEHPVESQPQFYSFISFKGDDIKELNVCESAPSPDQPMMHMPGQEMGYPSPYGYPQSPYMMPPGYGQFMGYGNPYDPQFNYYGYDPRVDPMQYYNNGYGNPMAEQMFAHQMSHPDMQNNIPSDPSQPQQPTDDATQSQSMQQQQPQYPQSGEPHAQQPTQDNERKQQQQLSSLDQDSTQKPEKRPESKVEKKLVPNKSPVSTTEPKSNSQTPKEEDSNDSNRSNQNRTKKSNQRSGNRGKRQNQRNKEKTTPETFTEDFDFESSLAKFDKEKLFAEIVDKDFDDEEDEQAIPVVAYEKSSFFDSISCEATDRETERVDYRASQKQQRKLDTETFGEAGRSSGRGGRGRRNNGRRGQRSYYRKRKNNDSGNSNSEKANGNTAS